MSLVGNWNYPTSIRFGAGRIKELPDACKAVGLKRPLLVTDPGLAKLPMISDAMTGSAQGRHRGGAVQRGEAQSGRRAMSRRASACCAPASMTA